MSEYLAATALPSDVTTVTGGTDFFDNVSVAGWVNVSATALGALLAAILLLWLLRRVLRRLSLVPASLRNAVLLVTVPKEPDDENDQRTDPKELLAQLEAFTLHLGSLPAQRNPNVLVNAWNNFWFGRHDDVSLEMVADRGLIKFFVAIPKHLQEMVELQLHAQVPNAMIEPVEDYNIFSPTGTIMGGYLKLAKRSMFPIRTYKKLDTDPLNALTNVLSKIGDDAGAAIQVLIRPVHGGWQRAGQRVAQKLQHGKALGQASSSGGLGSFFKGAASTATSSFRTTDQNQGQAPRVPYLTPMEQELIKSLEEKASKPGFEVNIRIIASAPDLGRCRTILLNLHNAFSQFQSQESGNSFVRPRLIRKSRFVHDVIFRTFSERHRFILNTEELTSLWHVPLPGTETPNILWLQARKAPPPVNLPAEGLTLGQSSYRRVDSLIKIKREDRRRHVYVIGTTGSGKSNLMAEMIKQDIQNGEGVCVVDPHGSLVEDVLRGIPASRTKDVILFDAADIDRPLGLNMLEAETPEQRDMAVQEMIAIFYKLFPPEMIGPMFEHNMRNVMLTLMEDSEQPGTIAEIPRMFTDIAFQKYKVAKVKDPVVRNFWEKEMAKTSDFHKSEMLGYLISKVGRFVENAMMRNVIGQPRSGFNLRKIMDEKKVLLVNLSKGRIGEVNANLLGLIIVSKLQMAALSRANLPEHLRNDFYLYIDEFQNFITDSIATILSEARKYRLNLTMAHQYMGQLSQGQDTKIRDAVLGNVGTMIAFRIGVEDADILAKQFAPVFNAFDLVNIDRYQAYVRLLIDNTASKPFNMSTFPPTPGDETVAEEVRRLSRLTYGRDRSVVEAEILERSKLGASSAVPAPPPMTERRG
ncbi:MAG: type IV secretion system DNA-binding domain-containing protein [Candidatus Kerfeldbacteria bacterium]|nr:type IV secretion system DNA-binding domain-containing protein [Candidatus Kerfeldbacteria bacterium]